MGSRPVLVTEYAPQGTLSGYLRALRVRPETTLEEVVMTYWWTRARALVGDLYSFVSDIASALVYLEKIAVVHGDVAARNVLLTASLTAKLNDFESACVIPHEGFVEIAVAEAVDPVRHPDILCGFQASDFTLDSGIVLIESVYNEPVYVRKKVVVLDHFTP
ncbi:unnamed protein product [Hydatigera taeniaeformis]|uniref:Protein kinase domain-containing protein n=1 Tax=Hydatigena taeniaeformis TaxID=6205 RepID=A0A3P7ERZ9_HYDTA|nr:unnamed protein product [Hydatigera taeniaeformis]